MMNAWKNFAGARRCGNRREKKKEETAEKTRNINPAHKNGIPAGGCRFWSRRPAQSESAEAVVSAAAEEQEDNDPAEISSKPTASASAATVMFETAVVIASSAAAAQDQDKENQVTAAVPSRLALASATAVCCRNITHMNSSKIFFTLHHMKRSLP